MDDTFTYTTIVIIAALLAIFQVIKSRFRDPLWWCDPRGPISAAIFFSSVGVPLFYVSFGEMPSLFGLHQEHLFSAVTMLVFGTVAYIVGTFVPINRRLITSLVPPLELTPITLKWLNSVLSLAIILSASVLYYELLKIGFVNLLVIHYGADQWLTVETSPWLHLSVLMTPLLCVLILAWGMTDKSYWHPWLLFMISLNVIPGVVLGGRKDVIMMILAFGLSLSIRKGSNSLKPLLILSSLIIGFNFIQAVSRSGDSLDLQERLSAVSKADKKNENTLVGQLSTVLPIAPTLTAVMTLYPEREPYTYGMSYVESVINTVVPRVVTGGNNLFDPPNVTFHNLYYPEVIDFGMDYALGAEGYQNFGVLGVVWAYFALGLFLTIFFEISRLRRNSAWVLMHLNIFTCGMWSLRSDSNSFMKVAVYGSVLVVVFYGIAKVLGATELLLRKSARSVAPAGQEL